MSRLESLGRVRYDRKGGAGKTARTARPQRRRWVPLLLGVGLLSLLLLATGCRTHRDVLPRGQYKSIPIARGDRGPAATAPLYLINFDKKGRCESPLTFKEVVALAESGDYTDVFVISHGWNNDWPAATHLYESFLGGFAAQQPDAQAFLGRPYRPLFVGIIWPSTVLMTAAERGPRAEGAREGGEFETQMEADEMRREIRDLAAQLADDRPGSADAIERELNAYLTPQAAGDDGAALRLAQRLAPACDDEEVPRGGGESTAEALVRAAREAANASASARGDGGTPVGNGPTGNNPTGNRAAGNNPTGNRPATDDPGSDDPAPTVTPGTRGTAGGHGSPAAPPEAAPDAAASSRPLAELGGLPDLRWIFRGASVWMMKDRAGLVGANGVADLVGKLVKSPRSRVHLIGHSYGAKVVLAATEAADFGPDGRVDSILLLQPAVSANCFAAEVPQVGGPGKYRPVLDRVRKPVFSTFSDKDWPLTTIYQRFVVRRSDLRELAAASARESGPAGPPPAPPLPPNVYAALGGFGPQPLPPVERSDDEVSWSFIQEPGRAYQIPPKVRVCGLRSKAGQIDCHGCVSNPYTWWALWSQVAAE